MSRIGEAANSRPQQQPQQQAGASTDVFQGQLDPSRAHQDILRGLDGKQACPFCGSVSERSAAPCARCGMDNTPEARKATKARIGPWYVLQARNPAAPGMRFETLLSFVRKGRVRARSVVRGPTTHQLWRFAAHVKGLSREFGLCFSCGSGIDPAANVCPQCNRLQEPPLNPDVLLEDGSEEQIRPVYRELPQPGATSAVPESAVHEPEPEDADIVIPAFGGFGHEEPAPAPASPSQTQFSAGPPVAPAAPASPMSVSMSYPPAATPAPASPSRPAPQQRPAPAATNENPFAIAPPPPRKKNNAGDGGAFLSAKELAAAFKLSFDPSADMDSVDIPDQVPASAMPDGMRPGPSVMVPRNPMGMTVANSAAPVRPRKRRGAFSKFVLFVLILAGTGFAVMMWVDPMFRARTIEWTKTTWTRIHNYATGEDHAKPRGLPATTNPVDDFNIPDPTPIRSTAVASQSPTTEPSSAPTVKATPAPEREPEPIAEPAEQEKVAVEVPPAPPPKPLKSTPAAKPAPQPEPPAVEEPSPQSNFAKMKELQKKAFAAQGKGDYKTALKLWEEIEKLPDGAHPRDLKVQLERARALAK